MNPARNIGASTLAVESRPPFERGSALFDNGIGRLLTVREVAERLACSEKTIRDWVLKRLIPTVRPMPRMVRFDEQDISRWLSERKQ